MSAGHSPAAPSGLARTVQCPGSIRMQEAYPEDPSSANAQAAAEGTAAHWAMAELMDGRLPMPGDKAPNGVLLTDEMIEAAEMIVEDVRQTAAAHGLTLADCACEVPVSISRIHPQCWGTPDIRLWVPGLHLYVWDLKFGFRHVPAFENYQLIAYSVGAIDAAGVHDLQATVTNRIVQPRSYSSDGPIRSWTYPAADVRAHVNIASMAVHEALGDNPKTHVGPECRDCRARGGCPTLARASQGAMDLAGTAMPHDLPPAALGVELRFVRRARMLLEARETAMEEQAKALIRAGARVPLWQMKQGAGTLVWKKPEAEVIAMGQMLGLQIAKPPKAFTPGQAKDAGFPVALLDAFSERRQGSASLEFDDGSEARRLFAKNS